MSYPESPFEDDFDDDLLIAEDYPNKSNIIRELKQWLCKAPNVSTIRFDRQQTEIEAVVLSQLQNIYTHRGIELPRIYKHDQVNALIVEHVDRKHLDFEQVCKQVIVDHKCASALLRGAQLYAPGVVGMTRDCRVDDKVSIFTDLNSKNRCKKGYAKVWESSRKLFIANGIVKLSRNELFNSETPPRGIAIDITDIITGAPPLDTSSFSNFNALLQNIPSVVTVECLELNKPTSLTILDMCASPGGKASHILTTMSPEATLTACDKTPKKVLALQQFCKSFNAKGKVSYKQVDWTKVPEYSEDEWNQKKFTTILLDAPCSALGNRPQLLNTDKDSVLKSFVPIQRKLITQASKMLQDGGVLVYSTCSISMAENEGIVAFALKRLELELVPSVPKLGGDGWNFEGIPHPEYLQRFGPGDHVESIGFFIAKFRKGKCII